jgi:hypothetical protein
MAVEVNAAKADPDADSDPGPDKKRANQAGYCKTCKSSL